MRLYLSGPMSNVPGFNIPAFETATANLRALGYEVLSPPELDAEAGLDVGIMLASPDGKPVPGATWGDCLARDVKIIADGDVDGIVLLPNWWKSKGARLEIFVGMLNRVKIYEYTGIQEPRPVVFLTLLHQLMASFNGELKG